ncbi:MAG: hypothetical protein Q4Q07_10370 [Tissierellia bacterium]|nr:hypothetical protein [Tissierellia bacterium]
MNNQDEILLPDEYVYRYDLSPEENEEIWRKRSEEGEKAWDNIEKVRKEITLKSK